MVDRTASDEADDPERSAAEMLQRPVGDGGPIAVKIRSLHGT
jgi:hypothetical protein